jgi:CBS domain containing-hemolysin-like protein
MVELLVAVGLVIVVSAICSLLEAVLYSVPVSHIEGLATAGNRAGLILQKLRADVDKPIAAILSLNNIANTAGAAVAGAIAARVLGAEWLVYFSAAFTLAILLFSEVMPKTAGVNFNRPLSTLVARPLQLLVWLFMPLIFLTQSITRLLGGNRDQNHVSDKELMIMASLGMKTGGIDAEEHRVIEGMLELENKSVRAIMTPRGVIFSQPAARSVREVHEQSGLLDHSRMPIYDSSEEDIIGMVHRRDVLTALAEGHNDLKLEAIMRPLHFVPDSLPANQLLRLFLQEHQHMAAVLDEFGGLAGVVTLEDVLEEVLGQEIVDEFDPATDMRELARRRRREVIEKGEANV